MKQFYNCLAALAITAAALATPSAFGYTALFAGHNEAAYFVFIEIGNTREEALAKARAKASPSCDTETGGFLDCDTSNRAREFWVSSSDDEPNCISLAQSNPNVQLIVPSYANTTLQAQQQAIPLCNKRLQDVSDTGCQIGALVGVGRTFATIIPDNILAVCDAAVGEEFGGLICDSHEFANESDGECEPCTAGTHVIVGGICTEQETCTENNVRNPDNLATCMPCDIPGEIADSDNTTCIPIPKKIEPITQVSVSVQISVTFLSVTLTMNTVRTSLNIITVTATNGEKFAVTTTSGSMLTITAFNGEEILVINNGSVTGTPQSGEQDGSTAINTISDDDHQKTAALAAGIGLGVGAIVL